MRSEIMLILAGMMAVTFMTRFMAPLAFKQMGIPRWFNRWMKYVPLGILTALTVPNLLLPQGYVDISWHNHYLLAGAVCILAAYRLRSPVLIMGLGLLTMFSLRWAV